MSECNIHPYWAGESNLCPDCVIENVEKLQARIASLQAELDKHKKDCPHQDLSVSKMCNNRYSEHYCGSCVMPDCQFKPISLPEGSKP